MENLRIIARLDVKGSNLIKGVNLEGLRVIGSPKTFAQQYYQQGADELIYIDTVASLYGRNYGAEIIKETSSGIFIPMTVGGGIRSVEDAGHLLRSGADKIAVNTAAVADPKLLNRIARKFGSQCVVSSIEAKRINGSYWEAYTHYGRERTGLDVVEWAKKCVANGAGEILLTSVDQEGTRRGFDTDLLYAVSSTVNVPIIASGGMGKPEDLISAVTIGKVNAIASADMLHYNRYSLADTRAFAMNEGLGVRKFEDARSNGH
jgi:imidazole glycerol-phosphate synthase subunit HisF